MKASMKKCVPSCMRKKSDDKALKNLAKASDLKTEQQLVCTSCKTSQSVAKDATVFVCVSCHHVNRTGEDVIAVDSKDTFVLKRVNSSTFAQLSDETKQVPIVTTSSTPVVTSSITPSSPTIGLCSVCMDGPGDMIFLKCNHGGFCEPCARHIAQNMAVGGSHCPRCREPIEALVRIVEMREDVVKAVSVEVVQAGGALTSKNPPKVPPPRGYNKAKKL